MFNLTQWTKGLIEENDPRAMRIPYKIYGKQTEKIMLDRYMKINEVDKPNISYPGSTYYLS